MKRIDTQSHFVTPRYLDAFLKTNRDYTVDYAPDGSMMLNLHGCRFMLFTRPLIDIDHRIQMMDEHQPGTMEVLSLSTPQVYMDDADKTDYLTRIVNDEFYELKCAYPDKFLTFASLPMPHVNKALDEIDRAMSDLKANGFVLGTSVLGEFWDQEKFAPVFQRLDDLNACLFFHPQPNIGKQHLGDYWLMPLNGFVFDTTCSVSRLVYSGFFQRYPNIRVLLPHLGGTIPYLFGRLDIGYYAYEANRKNISIDPTKYLKNLYYDTVSYSSKALRFAADLLGTDHMLYATDYPYVIGVPDKINESLLQADFTESQMRQINYENALRILNNVEPQLLAQAGV